MFLLQVEMLGEKVESMRTGLLYILSRGKKELLTLKVGHLAIYSASLPFCSTSHRKNSTFGDPSSVHFASPNDFYIARWRA